MLYPIASVNSQHRKRQCLAQTNTTLLNGKSLKCKLFGSILHLMRDSLRRNSQEARENIILHTGSSKKETYLLTSDALKCAVLYSGRSSTFAGKLWI